MNMMTVNIELDEKAAQIYTRASAEEQRKLQMLLGLWLREFDDNALSLSMLMDQISDRAEERGLTPEILESLLNDRGFYITN
jgi:hypothetical protein